LEISLASVFVNRIRSPIASVNFSLEHTELPCLVKWQLFLDAVLSADDKSFLPTAAREKLGNC
jgi:hypothetical protein